MEAWYTWDAWWETRVIEASRSLDDRGFKMHFSNIDYGDGIAELNIILTCRQPYLIFKQRIRFRQEQNAFGMDVMLPFEEMVNNDEAGRTGIVADHLYREVPRVMLKYKKKIGDFDFDRFISDWQSWFEATGWLPSSPAVSGTKASLDFLFLIRQEFGPLAAAHGFSERIVQEEGPYQSINYWSDGHVVSFELDIPGGFISARCGPLQNRREDGAISREEIDSLLDFEQELAKEGITVPQGAKSLYTNGQLRDAVFIYVQEMRQRAPLVFGQR